MSGLLHVVTHRHAHGTREGVGEVILCGFRLSRRVKLVWFRPDFDGARWYKLDPDVAEQVMECESAHEAMALVRS